MNIWIERLDSDSHPSNKTTTSNRDYNSLNIWYIFYNLKTTRTLTSKDMWMVVTMATAI
jgi:hypothetical protein